jgi:hypothetical protein
MRPGALFASGGVVHSSCALRNHCQCSGRRRRLTHTVRGDRSVALRELKALAAHANIAPAEGTHTTVAARSVVRPIMGGGTTTAIFDAHSAQLGDTPTLSERVHTGVSHSRPYHQARHDHDGHCQSRNKERYRSAWRLNRSLCRCCSCSGMAPDWDVVDLNVAEV